MTPLKVEVVERLADVAPEAWNALVGDGTPFLEWEWLASLEEGGCIGGETGWHAQHLVLRDGAELIGACPLYLKAHSQGEFVFDHGWAQAAARARIPYYPKLLVAVPFTPATGMRFLSHPSADRPAVIRALGAALCALCRRAGLSSVHVNFCLPDEAAELDGLGFVRRTGYQFQWINAHGWHTFEDYLGAFRSKRRNQIRREQRALDEQGIEIVTHLGAEIPDALFPVMYRLYLSTVDKYYWGQRYLNRAVFDLLRRRWKGRLCFIVARRGGEILAGTFNVRKADVLYGRYWGTFSDVRHLHFNVCYYAAVACCLREGIGRFEPGAGGEFKQLRGFDARPTTSMHYLRDPRLAEAVTRSLEQERSAIAAELEWMATQSAFKS